MMSTPAKLGEGYPQTGPGGVCTPAGCVCRKTGRCGHAYSCKLLVEDSSSVAEGIREMLVGRMEMTVNNPGQDVTAENELDVVEQVEVVLKTMRSEVISGDVQGDNSDAWWK